jgi:hypothetical protein
MITIPLGNDVRAEVIDSVLGQLSDGIWENSNGMSKYWSYADVNKNNELQVDDTSWRSGFNGKSEEWVRNWFADKAKQVVKIWAEDWGKGKDVWKRDNQDEVDYMGGHIVRDITVSDVYECYDYLKRRKGTYNYGKTEPEEVAPEVPAEVSPVTPKTSGGMNPSQQDLEDFFLDASTKTNGRKIVAGSLENYSYYQIGDCAYSVERISDTLCEIMLYKNKRFIGSYDFDGQDAYGQALAFILSEDEITLDEYNKLRDGSVYPNYGDDGEF